MAFKGFYEFGISHGVQEVVLPVSKIKVYLRKVTFGEEAEIAKTMIQDKELFNWTLDFVWKHIVKTDPKFNSKDEFFDNISENDISTVFWFLYMITYVKEATIPALEEVICENNHIQKDLKKIPLQYINPETKKKENIYKEKIFEKEFKQDSIIIKLFDGKVEWHLNIPTLKKSIKISELYKKESEVYFDEMEKLETEYRDLEDQIESLKSDPDYLINKKDIYERFLSRRIELQDKLLSLRGQITFLNTMYDEILSYTKQFIIHGEKEIVEEVIDKETGKTKQITKIVKDDVVLDSVTDIREAYRDLDRDSIELIKKEISKLKEYGSKITYVYECSECKKNKEKKVYHTYEINPHTYFFRSIPQSEF